MKKILIAGGSHADIPLILAAKKLGYHVTTSGNRPEDLGHLHSNEYRPADFSDPEEILRVARLAQVDALCSSCNDFSALSCAYAAGQMGLPGHDRFETSQTLHHKDLFRAFARAQGIPSPQAVALKDHDGELSRIRLRLPWIVKPIDLTGGKGVSTVRSMSEARPALQKAFGISRAKRVVVEEFLEGSRHGFSAFLRGGRVVFSFSDNEHYYLNPFLVSAASAPGDVPQAVENKLCEHIEKIAKALSLVTGVFHVQYILQDEEPFIIEVCRRAPGDLYVKLVEHATGMPYAQWIVEAACGHDCSQVAPARPSGFFTRHCVMSRRAGRVKNVVFDGSILPNVIDQLMWWQAGETVQDVLTSKFGIVFLKFSSKREMDDKTQKMQELIHVEVE